MLVELAAILAVASATTTPPCERAPPHAQPADGHYRFGIAGEPDLFLPGELYTVSLQGVDSGQGPTPFIGFVIWSEVRMDNSNMENETTERDNKYLGTFQAYDAQAKLHDYCTPAVDNSTAHPKTEIQVIWSAPHDIKETICIRFAARAGPVPSKDKDANTAKWSILAKELCSAPVAPPNFTRQPPIVEPCCACDEAKYEVTFEGLWSRNTHPREFPPENARAHFSEVIGASHTAQYRVWQEGRVASTGLRRLADDGVTTALEKELKAESDHIRTIIKARGISWQQVGGVGLPNTFAVFRVDAKHHLVSLASKLAPSPDWIVGVSALELCNPNCTWSTSATLPLFPYDAGTDNGLSYTSRRSPTIPPAPVRALRPDWPKDVRSPFYSTSDEMRPFARLKFTRLRLYERSCDATEGVGDHVSDTQNSGSSLGASGGGACATHTWGQWGPCSVSCGAGQTTRQREYIWPSRAYAEACRVPLTDYKRCRGPRMHCRAPSEYEPDPAEFSGPCAVSPWSEWSPCEGCGVRSRTRHYLAPRAFKRCHIGYRARMVMSQARPCDIGPCEKPPTAINRTNFDWFFVDPPRGECSVSAWGTWSPCSARCGRGKRIRNRLYIVRNSTVQQEINKILLTDWNQRFARLQNIEYPADNATGEKTELEMQVQEYLERCQHTLTLQESLCDGEDGACVNSTVAQHICKLPMSVGHCRGYEERWFYEWARGVCEPFGFTGCGGNGNNFRTRDHCLMACKIMVNTTVSPAETSSSDFLIKKLKPTPSSQDNEVMQNDFPSSSGEVVGGCQNSQWSGWGKCLGDCHNGLQLNYRVILKTKSSPEKTICHRLVKSKKCVPTHCKSTTVDPTDTVADQSFQHMNDPLL